MDPSILFRHYKMLVDTKTLRLPLFFTPLPLHLISPSKTLLDNPDSKISFLDEFFFKFDH